MGIKAKGKSVQTNLVKRTLIFLDELPEPQRSCVLTNLVQSLSGVASKQVTSTVSLGSESGKEAKANLRRRKGGG